MFHVIGSSRIYSVLVKTMKAHKSLFYLLSNSLSTPVKFFVFRNLVKRFLYYEGLFEISCNVVLCFLLGNSSAFEFYMPKFRYNVYVTSS